MVKHRAFGILLGLAIVHVRASEASPSAPEIGIVRFAGEVSRGKSFEKGLWNDLIFILKANDAGWDIVVTDGTDRDTDFVWVATPPYRLDNPRYLGTVYGHSAADAIAWTPRGFSFVVNRRDYAAAEAEVRKLLWPSGLSEAEIRTAEKTWAQVPRANGLLKITDAKLSEAKGDSVGRIESLSFEVEIRPSQASPTKVLCLTAFPTPHGRTLRDGYCLRRPGRPRSTRSRNSSLADDSTAFRDALQSTYGRRYHATLRWTARPWAFRGA